MSSPHGQPALACPAGRRSHREPHSHLRKGSLVCIAMLAALLAACTRAATPAVQTEATPLQTAPPSSAPATQVQTPPSQGTEPAEEAPSLTLPDQVPGPQRQCIEDQIGERAWREVSGRQRSPTAEETDAIRSCLGQGAAAGAASDGAAGGQQPPMAADAPLPQSPPDQEVSLSLGTVTISTFSPVTITDLEYSTNLYLLARNDGDQALTLRLTSWDDMHAQLPDWVFHFYAFQDEAVELEPGEQRTLEYMITNEGDGQFELAFQFRVEQTGDEGTLSVTVSSSRGPVDGLVPTAAVQGRVTGADGQPVSDVDVKVYLFNGRQFWTGRSDAQGNFYITLPSMADLQAMLGPRPLPYHSLDYFLLIETEGYELAYQDGIAPQRGETMALDVSLTPVSETAAYRQIGELATDGDYGYWWLLPNANFTRLAAVQAKHPPMLNVPGHFLMVDLRGQELWRITTGDECWGFDVAADGRVAAGCHDGTVYLADSEGNLLWQVRVTERDLDREVRFSPDGAAIFTGPYGGESAVLLSAATGEPVWTYSGPREWLRKSRFSPNGERIIAGFGNGLLTMFTRQGTPLWTRFIGQFPMVLEIDADYNVYAAGKNRELFSFDGEGNLRWRRRIANHVVTAGSMSEDGSLIVLGTVGDWLYAFNQTGDILWQRSGLMGHNSLAVTPNGEWIVDGSGSLYNRHGTLLWKPEGAELIRSTVAISGEAAYIATGDETNVIRIFERQP